MKEENNPRRLLKVNDALREFHLVVKDQRVDEAMPRELEIGFEDFDCMSGLEGGDLITITGWPDMGKTSFALSIVRNICIGKGIPVLYISPAIHSLGVLQRLVASNCKIALSRIRSGMIAEDEQLMYDEGIGDVARCPLYIEDNPAACLDTICSSCRDAVKEHHVRIVLIDNLQMIFSEHTPNRTPEDEIADKMRGLKQLARELDIPIVVVSQAFNSSFRVHSQTNRIPDSIDADIPGAIEEVSDKVFFVYRPEEYGIREDEYGWNTKGLAYILLVKNNSTGRNRIRLRFDGMCGRFQELREPLSSGNDW